MTMEFSFKLLWVKQAHSEDRTFRSLVNCFFIERIEVLERRWVRETEHQKGKSLEDIAERSSSWSCDDHAVHRSPQESTGSEMLGKKQWGPWRKSIAFFWGGAYFFPKLESIIYLSYSSREKIHDGTWFVRDYPDKARPHLLLPKNFWSNFSFGDQKEQPKAHDGMCFQMAI